MEARPNSELRLTATRDLTGKITITEQIWALITPQSLRLRKTVDAYCRIFQQLTADIQAHDYRYQVGAWQVPLDYFCNACKEGLRHYVEEDVVEAATTRPVMLADGLRLCHLHCEPKEALQVRGPVDDVTRLHGEDPDLVGSGPDGIDQTVLAVAQPPQPLRRPA